MNVFALLVYQSVDECVMYALLIYLSGGECVYLPY